MFCSSCGTNIPEGGIMCPKCGTKCAQQSSTPQTNVNYADSSTYSTASGISGLKYVVLQVTLKEKLIGTGSGNLTALEQVINDQASKGYRLHTITTASAQSGGFLGGDRIQATMVFERIG